MDKNKSTGGKAICDFKMPAGIKWNTDDTDFADQHRFISENLSNQWHMCSIVLASLHLCPKNEKSIKLMSGLSVSTRILCLRHNLKYITITK
jgi:hypothetical protein